MCVGGCVPSGVGITVSLKAEGRGGGGESASHDYSISISMQITPRDVFLSCNSLVAFTFNNVFHSG